MKLEIVHRPAERDLTRRVQELSERLERLEVASRTGPGAG